MADLVQALLAPEYDIDSCDWRGKTALLVIPLPPPSPKDLGYEFASLDALLPRGARVVVVAMPAASQAVPTADESPLPSLLRDRYGSAFKGVASGPSAAQLVASLQDNEVCMLDSSLLSDDAGATPLSSVLPPRGGFTFVFDAFSSSSEPLPPPLASAASSAARRLPGASLLRELRALSDHVLSPAAAKFRRPLGLVVGGAKPGDKLGLLRSLARRADVVMLGGRVALTFLAARGVHVGGGAAHVDKDAVASAAEVEVTCDGLGKALLLPVDGIVVDESSAGEPSAQEAEASPTGRGATRRVVRFARPSELAEAEGEKAAEESKEPPPPSKDDDKGGAPPPAPPPSSRHAQLHRGQSCGGSHPCPAAEPCIPHGWTCVDVGPSTLELFLNAISGCTTIVWNGPLGKVPSLTPFDATSAVATCLAAEHDERGVAVLIAGDDTAAAAEGAGVGAGRVTHVSRGGEATLALLAGEAMPGLSALLNPPAHKEE